MSVIELQINCVKHRVDVEADSKLLNVLRDELDLTGTKYGCGEAQCGACTVLIDGQTARSCVTSVIGLTGKQITTIESLEQSGRLHPVQQAFLDAGAMQCGYCIPGMIMSAVGFLKRNPHPTDQEILRVMERNVCRCGTHPRIFAAIRKVAGTGKGGVG